jgi:hypothetical protein
MTTKKSILFFLREKKGDYISIASRLFDRSPDVLSLSLGTSIPIVVWKKKEERIILAQRWTLSVVLQYPMRVKSERNPKSIKTVVHASKITTSLFSQTFFFLSY